MTVDEMLCRWAERKYKIAHVTRVDFVFYEGWGGTDVTPGESANMSVRVYEGDTYRSFEDLEFVPALIREIGEFALRR